MKKTEKIYSATKCSGTAWNDCARVNAPSRSTDELPARRRPYGVTALIAGVALTTSLSLPATAQSQTAAPPTPATPATASAQPAPTATTAAATPPAAAPTIAARAWLLMDYGSGQILAADKPDQAIEPASLTKLMTAYLSFSAIRGQSLSLEQNIEVSDKAWKTSGSRMFLQPGRPVTVKELLHGMIVQSGNDACVALAEAIAGSEEAFAQMMTREARRLGMTHTTFLNATGLTQPGHTTTVRDLARLAAAIVRDFPDFYPIYGEREFTYNRITQPNRNRLLWIDPSVDGLKTGHTEAAGYNLVASAQRDGRRLISVVTGTTSDTVRAQESHKLLNYGFAAFERVQLHTRKQEVSRFTVRRGQQDDVAVGFADDVILSVPRGAAPRLRSRFEAQPGLTAPVRSGQNVGLLKVELDGQTYASYPVIALSDVAETGWLGRWLDDLRQWLARWFD